MSQVKIGVHYIPTHGRSQDMDFLAALPAPSVKIVYSSKPDGNHLREVMRRTAGRVVLRDHALSEQFDDVRRDPRGTGVRHAREWRQHLDEIGGLDYDRILVEGINEPPIWEGPDRWATYYMAFGMEAQGLGLRTVQLNLSVGWPGNGGAGEPPNWSPFMVNLGFIDGHPGHVLGLHEYWGFNTGVHFYAGWWFLRYRQMPFKVPTMLTELGGLKAYQNQDGSWGLAGGDGWKGDIGAEQYLAQWQQAEAELRADPYIDSAHLFTTDGGHPWIEECDAEPVNRRWLEFARQQLELPTSPAGTHTIHLPTVGVDGQSPTAAEPEPQPTPQIPVVALPLIDPRVAEALVAVEAGRTHDEAGRLIIRFEAHIFLARADVVKADDFFKVGSPAWTGQEWRPSVEAAWRPVHTGRQADEYAAFEFACRLALMSAHESISMGAGQVMGFHFARLGYSSAMEMFAAFERSAAAQMLGFANFVLSDPLLHWAINEREWSVIGVRYNGTASAGAKYRAAYARLLA